VPSLSAPDASSFGVVGDVALRPLAEVQCHRR
jgi:hypothetical protein